VYALRKWITKCKILLITHGKFIIRFVVPSVHSSQTIDRLVMFTFGEQEFWTFRHPRQQERQ
jgi:hypothetical protein